MAESAFGPEAQAIFDSAGNRRTKTISLDGQSRQISIPFPSPADWRDTWIYFLMVDRFNNPVQPPASTLLHPPIAFDSPFGEFQGVRHHGAQGPKHDVRPLAQDFGVAEGDDRWCGFDGLPNSRSTGITDERRPGLPQTGVEHIDEFVLILGLHHDDIRHAPQVG